MKLTSQGQAVFNPKKQDLFTWSKDRPRNIGFYDPRSKTWVKKVKDKNLMLAYGKSPGWQADVLDSLPDDWEWLEAQCDNGTVFRLSRKVFEDHKESKDFGYGMQYFVPRKFWEIIPAPSTNNPQQRLL